MRTRYFILLSAGLLAGLLWLTTSSRDSATALAAGDAPATQPGTNKTPATSPALQPSMDQQCQQLVDKWHPLILHGKLQVMVRPPFVVAGDCSDVRMRDLLDHTILGSQRAFNAMYFHKEPSRPILILLYVAESNYRYAAANFLGDTDVSPYGYSRSDGILIMNISTGGGTLVHELFHALVAFDFPDIPRWYNEGMGSLYEQSQFTGDHIVGLPNWRLPALQKAIEAGTVRPLKDMIEDPEFYAKDRVGLNYAQARYLMQYLQEKQLLQQYYRDFHAAHDAGTDLTGYTTLLKTIAPMTEQELDATWHKWVLSLRFP